MKKLVIFLMFLFVSGCAAIDATVVTYVDGYCSKPLDERLLYRSALAIKTSPHVVTINCDALADVPADSAQ